MTDSVIYHITNRRTHALFVFEYPYLKLWSNQPTSGPDGYRYCDSGCGAPCLLPSNCVDTAGEKLCQPWAQSGECARNPGYMLVQCRKSCGLYVTGGLLTRITLNPNNPKP